MEKKFIISTGIKGMKYWEEVEKQLNNIEKERLGLSKKNEKAKYKQRTFTKHRE